MDGRNAALDFVAGHCDIVERLQAAPATARMRGVLFRSIQTELERRGKLEAYRAYFPHDRYSSVPFYPLRDYLLRVAVAGAVVASPERVHDGMREVSRGNAVTFAESLLGRTLIRVLARDPVRLTEQGLAARRLTSAYGQWSIVRHGERELEMRYRDEYLWIESAIAGAAAGTFEACGLSPQLETRLTGRFDGSTLVRW